MPACAGMTGFPRRWVMLLAGWYERRIVLAIWFVLAAAPAFAQTPSRWPDEAWNPRPLPDDLVLPLPCNGAIAFRPVPTPVGSGNMSDRPTVLGQSDPETDYSEYLRQTFLLGPFRGTDPTAPPRYYLGKYEVTRDQYLAVTTTSCPALPAQGGRVPQSEIAWHEAVDFTVRLSTWLTRNARDALPTHDDARAFVRLPTEDEWEFAARGGAAVSEADFSARTFPMPEGLQRYAWFQGSRSADNRIRPVGSLEPNPLGLFDILGNVSEWVLDPYRLNKVGRPHGQAGGLVARGGDLRTAESQIRSSLRVELPPMNQEGDPLRLRNVGFRPALAMVATYSDQRPAALREAFRQEADARTAAADDPARLLEVLRNETQDPALRQGITRIEGALRAETRARKDQEGQTLRAQIEAAGFIGRQIIVANGFGKVLSIMANQQGDAITMQGALADAQNRLAEVVRGEVQAKLRELADKTRDTDRPLRRGQELLTTAAAAQPERIRDLAAVYLGIVLSVGRTVDRLRIADEGNVVLQQVRGRAPLPLLPEAIHLVVRHMVETSGGRPPGAEEVVKALIALSDAPPPAPARGR